MSGHNKWSTIKHKKAKQDQERGKMFSKLIKEITTAARLGGGDVNNNPRLRTAVNNAYGCNMPKNNVEKAIKKGTGDLPGVSYEELSYEGYGPGGVAVFLEILTDNKNRTASEIRHLFGKYGGNMGESGCVSWMFDRCGEIIIEGPNMDEDTMMEAGLEAGANDVQVYDDVCLMYTDVETLDDVRQNLENQGYTISHCNLTRIPQTTVSIEGKQAESMMKMIEVFEEHDDVQNVYANFDIPDEVLQSA